MSTGRGPGRPKRTENRPKRVPLGRRNILTVSGKDPKYVYRWFNDRDDRISRAKDAGYELVSHEAEVGDPQAGTASQMGSNVSKSVGSDTRAYLMRIPKEYYQEDQEAKARDIRESQEALGLDFTGASGNEKYGNVSISTSLNQENANGES